MGTVTIVAAPARTAHTLASMRRRYLPQPAYQARHGVTEHDFHRQHWAAQERARKAKARRGMWVHGIVFYHPLHRWTRGEVPAWAWAEQCTIARLLADADKAREEGRS